MAISKDVAQQHLYETDLSGKRVLIIDRHPAARDALRLMLSNLAITKVIGAGSSAEVLRQVRGSTFDIILSDYLLEDGRDGQQLLEELRIQKLVPLWTVFIVVTSERLRTNVVGVAELTPDDYLVKPFTADQLNNRLAKALFRKARLGKILRHLDQGAYGKALAACDEMIAAGEEPLLEAQRYQGQILNALGRHADAEVLYRNVLANRPFPWASMGLATALFEKGDAGAAEQCIRDVLVEHPNFMAAHDFLARILERNGKLDAAQAALVAAAEISPHNTGRQRIVGDVALRNGDLETAEKSYQNVLDRARNSTVSSVDDYGNLSRVYLSQGKTLQAKTLAQELRRERRWDPAAELAAHVVDSMALRAEGAEAEAKAALDKAITTHQQLLEKGMSGGAGITHSLSVDLAQAALAAGEVEKAGALLRQVIGENPDDLALRNRVEQAFESAGHGAAGKAMLEEVTREIVGVNNKGVLLAKDGKLDEAVELLSQAAERMPNTQFLVNASNAVFTQLDRTGWNEELAQRGLGFLLKAQQKDLQNSRVIAAFEFFSTVAQKFGLSPGLLRQQALDANKKK